MATEDKGPPFNRNHFTPERRVLRRGLTGIDAARTELRFFHELALVVLHVSPAVLMLGGWYWSCCGCP
ncbi:MAG TPA: hypothetical protein VFA00_06950 [Actinomycetota bacterium]|nr:hypothetical protein [Actinomycetota bacterium]